MALPNGQAASTACSPYFTFFPNVIVCVGFNPIFILCPKHKIENELDTHYDNHHIMVAVVMMHHTILMSNTSPLLHMCF